MNILKNTNMIKLFVKIALSKTNREQGGFHESIAK